jgi:hypothetical protein
MKLLFGPSSRFSRHLNNVESIHRRKVTKKHHKNPPSRRRDCAPVFDKKTVLSKTAIPARPYSQIVSSVGNEERHHELRRDPLPSYSITC